MLFNERLSDLDGGEGDQIILQGDKRQVPFNIRRANYGSYFSGTYTHFRKKKILSRIEIVKKEYSKGFFRVEDKVGLLKERDQTIVTLETEVSEVTYKKPTNIGDVIQKKSIFFRKKS